MAILRPKEIRDQKLKARSTSLQDLKRELTKLNSQKGSGRMPENPGKIKAIRRTIARILTINQEEVSKSNE